MEIWTTPHGFLQGGSRQQRDGSAGRRRYRSVVHRSGKNRYVGTINEQNEVAIVRTWIDNPVLGDTEVQFNYSDYKDFSGVRFPSRIVRVQGGHPVLDITVSSVTANPGLTATPPAAQRRSAPVTVTVEKLANGVYYLKGGTHHSVAIDQKDHIVVVEGPQNEERSLAVIAKVKETIPNKPIRYLINTHVHFDHSGGLRTYVDEGATIVTHQMNKPYYEKAWAAPHTLNPDELAQSKKTATFETFTDKHVLTDGARTIEVHQIAGGGHNDAFAMVYLPAEKILIGRRCLHAGSRRRPSAGDAEPVLGQLERQHPAAEAGRAADRGAARAATGDDGRPSHGDRAGCACSRDELTRFSRQYADQRRVFLDPPSKQRIYRSGPGEGPPLRVTI